MKAGMMWKWFSPYLAIGAFIVMSTGSARAGQVFHQGFEADTSDWFGTAVTRVNSGTDSISSFQGDHHAIMTGSPFTRFDGYRSTWPGTITASIAIYLDTSWEGGSGFDYTVAATKTNGDHLRDFIFHVTKNTSDGPLLVGGSNNTDFVPKQNLGSNIFEVQSSGWYLFEHVFRDDDGVLAVDLNLRDAVGGLLFTETRSQSSDTMDIVGGNRYGWFTHITSISGGLAVDDVSLSVAAVPEPSTLLGGGIAVLILAVAAKRRNWRMASEQAA